MHVLRTVLATVTIGIVVCAAASAHAPVPKVKLYAQNRPGETGTATFQQIAGGVRIVVKMAGAQNGVQPAHIHTGSCARLNPRPRYALADVVRGSSVTTIRGVTLARLLKGRYVIDVHESSADVTRYVACAAIRDGSTP
jgi:hypothetical protein